VLRSRRETTQSDLAAVAHWATGLEPIYFEGAFARALRAAGRRGVPADSAPVVPGGVVTLEVDSLNPELPFVVMASRTTSPGARRLVHNGGSIVYLGPAHRPAPTRAATYRFRAQYGSPNAAALLANVLWKDLRAMASTVRVDGTEVPIQHSALKKALLGARLA
jgi:hypothetical protein